MKIVDTFIFLAEHETELMLLKFILEDPYVDEFIAIENHYTYRGDYKGAKLAGIINGDERFAPYRHKIKIFSIDRNFSDPNINRSAYDPPQFAEAEWSLREVPTDYLIKTCPDATRVFVSDVDEVIDFSDPERAERLLEWLRKPQPLQFERIRYWYDFDNRGWRSTMDMTTPAFTVGHLKQGIARLRDKKWVGIAVPNGDNPLIFEYSFCFDYAGILYKFNTSLHTNWSEVAIQQSLLCNHWTMRNGEQVCPNNRYQWFEKVKLTPKNSPKYVRDNLESLKTRLVPDNYKDNRQWCYSFEANFPENIP